MAEPGRDLTWDAMCTFADRINTSGRAGDLQVRAVRRRRWQTGRVVHGLWVGDDLTDVFEPVRSRSLVGRNWRELQSVAQAASHIGAYLRCRADLATAADVAS